MLSVSIRVILLSVIMLSVIMLDFSMMFVTTFSVIATSVVYAECHYVEEVICTEPFPSVSILWWLLQGRHLQSTFLAWRGWKLINSLFMSNVILKCQTQNYLGPLSKNLAVP